MCDSPGDVEGAVMEYIIAVDTETVILGLVCAMGLLSIAAGIYGKILAVRICGFIGFGLMFPLLEMYL